MRGDFMNSNDDLIKYFKNERKAFDVNEMTLLGREKFNSYYDIKSNKLSSSFDSDKWVFSEKYIKGVFYFEFEFFVALLKFNKKIQTDEFLIALKVWTINNLTNMGPTRAYRYFSNLLSIVIFTKGLNSNFNNLEELIYDSKIYSKLYGKSNIFTEKTVQPITAKKYITSLVSFANFYPNHNIEITTIENLYKAADSLKIVNYTRSLPHPKDILNLKDCIEDFYEKESRQNSNSAKLIRFFPLILWWDISSIIPIRPSEFCSIHFECLKEGKLEFPRFKQVRNSEASRQNIEYDLLPLPTKIIEKIELYQSLVKDFGIEEQLISLPAHLKYGLDILKKNVDYSKQRFSVTFLQNLIDKFYQEILEEKYKLTYETKIKPGDLRHIAIISMMVQGYDRVHIQRMAGHTSLNIHYSYTEHMQYWVDTEIQTLCTQFSLQNNEDFVSPTAIDFYNEINRKTVINEILDSPNGEVKIELAIGHCKDEDMNCPTFNWNYSGCYHCENWGIDTKELAIKKEVIISELSSIYNDLKRKVVYLAGLYNVQNFNEIGTMNPSLKTQLSATQKEINDKKKLIVQISNMLGVEEFE